MSKKIAQQMSEYFGGVRTQFEIRTQTEGTPFQKAVWKAIASIPYGETRTYADVARMIGRPKAARAVGNALNKNPVCIIIPCHRVVSSTGLGGYAFGLKAKKWLIQHEKRVKGKK